MTKISLGTYGLEPVTDKQKKAVDLLKLKFELLKSGH